MAQQSSYDKQIGEAWGLHRESRNEEAAQMFNQILSAEPDNVDATYGLGLAQRDLGQRSTALSTFEQALALAESRLESLRAVAKLNNTSNDLKSGEDDRFMMLIRMINQRLAEIRSGNLV